MGSATKPHAAPEQQSLPWPPCVPALPALLASSVWVVLGRVLMTGTGPPSLKVGTTTLQPGPCTWGSLCTPRSGLQATAGLWPTIIALQTDFLPSLLSKCHHYVHIHVP